MKFGERIKELRESQGLLQRHVAASLDIDTPMLSKIERGERRAKRVQVLALAALLHADEKELLTIWLSDKIIGYIAEESTALAALKHAETKLKEIAKNEHGSTN